MKKNILTMAVTTIAAIATLHADAQAKVTDSGYYINPCDETIFIKRSTAKRDTGKDHLQDIHIRAIQNFHKEFPSIDNESWYKSYDGGYIANFKKGSVQTVVAFNPKGKLHHTISYYDEQSLPHDVWTEVKSAYYAYNILRIEEINFEDHKIYLVHLEDHTYHKVIGVTDDNMMEIESFRKV
jgi:hypothetical protein